ncbi:MAG: ABC transporter permease [Sarcina sp.]
MHDKLKGILKYLYAILIILTFWYIVHKLLNSFVVPSPLEVFVNFFKIALPKLSKHVVVSGFRLLIALSITSIIGYSLGLYIGINKKANNLISPIIYLLFPIPRIAFLPVFMIIFGLGDLSKIILIIAIAVFQIIVSTRDSTKEISNELLLSAKSLKLSKKDMIKDIYIPATLPKFFTALRIGVGSGMAALFFAENYATKYGIGYFIMNSWTKVDYVGMYSGIIAISILGIIIFKIIDLIEEKMCKWKFKI